MKTIVRLSITMILCLTIGIPAQSETNREYKQEKIVQHHFDLKKATTLLIDNRFGDINVSNWDKNAVSLEILITAYAPSEEEATEALQQITVEAVQNKDLIQCKTKKENNGLSNRGFFYRRKKKISYTVDYTVKVPKDVSLKLFNNYGNIKLAEHHARVALNVNFGDISIQKLTLGDADKLNTIKLNYGKLNINEANWLQADLKYSDLKVHEKVHAMIIKSRYSDLNLNSLSSLVIDCTYGTIKIDTINNINCQSRYSNIYINKLLNKMQAEAYFGDIKVQDVANTFQDIKLETRYTDVLLGIKEGYTFGLKLSLHYSDFSSTFPLTATFNNFNSTNSEQFYIKCIVGKNKTGNPPQISCECQYGTVRFGEEK